MIVRAVRTDGEEIVARTGKQHFFVADIPDQHAAVGKSADGNALGEIRPGFSIGIVRGHLPVLLVLTFPGVSQAGSNYS